MKNLLALLLILWIIPAHALNIHVATTGSDSNKGTQSKPLLSIEAAQKKLRASGRIGKEFCKIIIHRGTYRLNTPLSMTTDDGGSEKYPVIYCAAENEEVVITELLFYRTLCLYVRWLLIFFEQFQYLTNALIEFLY